MTKSTKISLGGACSTYETKVICIGLQNSVGKPEGKGQRGRCRWECGGVNITTDINEMCVDWIYLAQYTEIRHVLVVTVVKLEVL